MADDDLRVLGDRYEIHRAIARGGMAQVYLARDRTLDRPVAVKELVPEFATDPSFVERFRREAQSAARLTHPNIVSVYDWGTQDGTYFIVMEYVDGPSLSQLIRRDGALHPRRAAEIAGEVAAALGFAHSQDVVHRDIKPGNVLLTSTGQAKVADFGIARALSASEGELTQTGSVMGTATYFSPEQAQGLPIDARADLYSLGVVLYEMVTGRPPFTGDTPLAISYKHVQDQPPRPSAVSPGVPVGLEAIILKLLSKQPADRYDNAEALRADLDRFLAGQPTLAEDQLAAVAAAAAVPAAATTVQPVVDPVDDDYSDDDQPKSRTGLFIGVLVVLLALLGGLLFWFARGLNAADVEVPATIGLMRSEAETLLRGEGFEVEVSEQANPSIEAGRVISQDPAPKTKAPDGSKVTLVVSLGPAQVPVPEVAGRTQAEGEFILAVAGLRSKIIPIEDPDTEPGRIISSNPAANVPVAKDSEVELRVSKGPGEELVPNVGGQSLSAAQAALQAAGFKIGGPDEEPSDDVAKGKVIRTDPPVGTSVKKGSTVTVIVSSGVAQVQVPSVVGDSQSSAEAAITGKGFKVEVTTENLAPSDSNVGKVMSQEPSGGSSAEKGSTVRITVGVASPTTSTSSSTTTSSP
jgi:serine/threonine-protein kinase